MRKHKFLRMSPQEVLVNLTIFMIEVDFFIILPKFLDSFSL